MRILATLVVPLALVAACDPTSSIPPESIPSAAWVEIYFEGIDEAARGAGLGLLRETEGDELDVELRIWDVPAFSPVQGYRIARRTGLWEALRICQGDDGKVSVVSEKRQDWSDTWERLMYPELIPSIKDDSEIEHKRRMRDGVAYVVEVLEHREYRTFMVNNPRSLPSPSADKMLAVMLLIYNAFGGLPCPEPAA